MYENLKNKLRPTQIFPKKYSKSSVASKIPPSVARAWLNLRAALTHRWRAEKRVRTDLPPSKLPPSLQTPSDNVVKRVPGGC